MDGTQTAAADRSQTALELLRRLSAEGVHLTVAMNELHAHPAAILYDADRRQIAEYRPELMALLAPQAEVFTDGVAK